MKECVFGWYPPAYDLWKSGQFRQTGQGLTPDSQQCMYNQGIPSPVIPATLKGSSRGRLMRSRGSGSRPSSHAPQTDGLRVDSSAVELHEGRMCEGAPLPRAKSHTPSLSVSHSPVKMFSPSPPKSRTPSARSSPVKAWSTNLPETQVTMPLSPSPHITKVGMPASLSPQVGTTLRPSSSTPLHRSPSVHPPPGSSGSARPSRIQSATTSRARVTPPARPVKSAGPVRSAPSIPTPFQEAETVHEEEPDPNMYYGPVVAVKRAEVPSPGPVITEEDEDELGVYEPFDYDAELQRHGWRMEVPGDPLNLKRPCVQKRLSYTCKLEVPTIKPNPPKGKMENFDTYFYNTIPRRKATFAIHKEWMSEVLHAKRMELQKRECEDSYKYRHTDYSFVY